MGVSNEPVGAAAPRRLLVRVAQNFEANFCSEYDDGREHR